MMTSTLYANARQLAAIGLVLLVSACAIGPRAPDVDYKLDYDFSGIRTLALYDDAGKVSGDNPMQLSDIQKDRINQALGQALQAKGLQLVNDASQADALLSWHLVTQFKTDVRSYNSPGVFSPFHGYNRYSGYSCWNCIGGGAEIVSRNYTEGYFIVDIIDPKMEKSVWRGTLHSRLKDDQLKNQEVANAAALRIFDAFPPGQVKAD